MHTRAPESGIYLVLIRVSYILLIQTHSIISELEPNVIADLKDRFAIAGTIRTKLHRLLT